MFISPRDRLTFRPDLDDTRKYGRTIGLLIPNFADCVAVGCGYDPLHDSGVNPACSVCGGVGRIATWTKSSVFANVRIVDEAMVAFRRQPPGAQLGDTFISISVRDEAMTRKCLDNKDAYFLIDASVMRPKSIQGVGVGQTEELVVLMTSFNPILRATGY